jgi:aldehyde dehydrogenase (NAD+)
MQEEIFGPILPLIAVEDVDAAIDFVNAREKPLAMYVFSEDSRVTDHVLTSTTAGGVCVNATLFHLAVPALPFGGVGASGMGAYHGRSSFETFTHEKSVLTKPTKLDPSVMYPPYKGLKAKLLRRFL